MPLHRHCQDCAMCDTESACLREVSASIDSVAECRTYVTASDAAALASPNLCATSCLTGHVVSIVVCVDRFYLNAETSAGQRMRRNTLRDFELVDG